jgi:hypothetical protein
MSLSIENGRWAAKIHLHVNEIDSGQEMWAVCIENMSLKSTWIVKCKWIVLYIQCLISEYQYLHIIAREINFNCNNVCWRHWFIIFGYSHCEIVKPLKWYLRSKHFLTDATLNDAYTVSQISIKRVQFISIHTQHSKLYLGEELVITIFI